MNRTSQIRILLLLAALGAPAIGGCTPTQAKEVRDPSTRLQREVNALRGLLKVASSKAMCSQEVRSLITLIKHECGMQTSCPAQAVQALTREIEPHERFLWLMRDMPHVVVYLSEDEQAKSGPGQSIVEKRLGRLQRLLERPWLDWTQLLIIGHGGAREAGKDLKAQQRADKVKEYIMSTEFGKWAAQRAQYFPNPVMSLSYSFPLQEPTQKQLKATGGQNDVPAALELLNKNVLLQKDMPLQEEPRDVSRGVWVFLVECADEL